MITKKILLLSMLISTCEVDIVHAMSFNQEKELMRKLNTLESKEEKNTFAIQILTEINENGLLQELRWDPGELGAKLVDALSIDNKDAFALKVLNAAYDDDTFASLGELGAKLVYALSVENRDTFVLKVLNDAYDDDTITSLNKLEKRLIYALSVENRDAFAIKVLNDACDNNTLILLGDFGRDLFYALSTENKSTFALKVLSNTYYNNIFISLGDLGRDLFNALPTETKNSIAFQILNCAYNNNTLQALEWSKSGLLKTLKIVNADGTHRSLSEYENNALKFGDTLFDTLSLKNKRAFGYLYILDAAINDTLFESKDPVIKFFNGGIPKTDPFYVHLIFLIKKPLQERTIEDISKIIEIAYGEGTTKERLKPMCIAYLENNIILLPENESLNIDMEQFADLFLPLLEKRNGKMAK